MAHHGLLGLEHVHERYVRQRVRLRLRPWWLRGALRCRCWMAHARPARTRARARALRATAGTLRLWPWWLPPCSSVPDGTCTACSDSSTCTSAVRQWLLLRPVHWHVRICSAALVSNGTCPKGPFRSTASISSSARALHSEHYFDSATGVCISTACDSGSAFDFDFGVCVSCPSLDNGTCLDCIDPTICERSCDVGYEPKVGERGLRADLGTPPNGT